MMEKTYRRFRLRANRVGNCVEYELLSQGSLLVCNGFSLLDLSEQNAISRLEKRVDAARDYLHSPAGEKEYEALTGQRPRERGSKIEAPVIAEFLDWERTRVEEALAEIGEIEDPHLTEPERAT